MSARSPVPMSKPLRRRSSLPVTLLTAALILSALTPSATGARVATDEAGTVTPSYDAEGRLQLPEGIERWVLAGTSLSLSYTEGRQGSEMFHNTLIEPTAYEHFRATGTFRDGTMLALLLQPQGDGVLPARGGTFADTQGFLEMAVKDSSRPSREEDASSWAYYNFGTRSSDPSNSRARATPMPARSCQSCHDQHAAYDNVFLQFYPLLAYAAPEGSPAEVTLASLASDPARPNPVATQETEGTAVLALGGLDPVLLVDGRREEGKAELEMQHAGFRYRFVSEPSRSQFAEEPDRFKIQNETCPVVAGAAIDPSLVSVHRERIYAFATAGCVTTFEADPDSFVSEGVNSPEGAPLAED